MDQELKESGTILYLREHTEEMRINNKRLETQGKWIRALVILAFLAFVSLVGFVIYLSKTNFLYWIIYTYKITGCV